MTCSCYCFDPSDADADLCECGHYGEDHDDDGICLADYGDDDL
ncbi:hypothetical protein [Kribbella sp. NPDC023855]